MTTFRLALAALAAASAIAAGAHAQSDPIVLDQSYLANTTIGSYLLMPSQGEDVVVYSPVFVQADGGTQFRLNTLQLAVYRKGTAAAPAPAVDVEAFVREMTFDPATGAYGLGPLRATGTSSLAASNYSGHSYLNFTWGATDPASRPVISLMNAINGANGYGGFWVGQRFTGPNAASTLNYYRRVNEPTKGHSFNWYALHRVSTDAFTTGLGWDYYSVPWPSRMYAKVGGAVVDAGMVPTDQLCGRSCASQWTYAPPSANDGVGSQWVYVSQFCAAAPGDAMMPTRVVVPIWRAGTAAAPAAATTVELALVTMTWGESTGYRPGEVITTTTRQLPATSVTGPEAIHWEFPASSGVAVPVNTDNPGGVGYGGWWVAVRFRGDGATLAGGNYLQVGYAPLTGLSLNSYGMYDLETGAFVPWHFGNYANDETMSQQPRPSRMIAETYGRIGIPPARCPADLNGDRVVNGADLGLLLGAWGHCPSTPCTGDINLDGEVNGADLGLLLGAWGPCP